MGQDIGWGDAPCSEMFQLGFSHPKVVTKFVEHSLPDLMPDLGLIMTHSLDVLSIKNNSVRSERQVEHTSPGGWHSLKQSQKQPPRVVWSRMRTAYTSPFLPGRFVFNQNRQIAEPGTKFFWKSVKDVRHDFNEAFPLHVANLHHAFWRDFN
jgi:hypothetical protein